MSGESSSTKLDPSGANSKHLFLNQAVPPKNKTLVSLEEALDNWGSSRNQHKSILLGSQSPTCRWEGGSPGPRREAGPPHPLQSAPGSGGTLLWATSMRGILQRERKQMSMENLEICLSCCNFERVWVLRLVFGCRVSILIK
ncbi:hypothetical protein CDAR_75991 [Caerostris darwini]|uniref:Uncharacterized protein n=1 Tax=Caerostris darwini TaxID=1538125 RepID=A0AAV4Q7M2_9ARAC|nr:hypothetical protein CDAR_75991 [Caerostris darwini]